MPGPHHVKHNMHDVRHRHFQEIVALMTPTEACRLAFRDGRARATLRNPKSLMLTLRSVPAPGSGTDLTN